MCRIAGACKHGEQSGEAIIDNYYAQKRTRQLSLCDLRFARKSDEKSDLICFKCQNDTPHN